MKHINEITRYIHSIRNSQKKDYAQRYWKWLVYHEPGTPEPDRLALSYMAAQAVRMQLQEIKDGIDWAREHVS